MDYYLVPTDGPVSPWYERLEHERTYTTSDAKFVLELCELSPDWLDVLARLTLALQGKLPDAETKKYELRYFYQNLPSLTLPGSDALEKAGWFCKLLSHFRYSWPECLGSYRDTGKTPLAWLTYHGDLLIDYAKRVLDAVSVIDEGDVRVLSMFRTVCIFAETNMRIDINLLHETNESLPKRRYSLERLQEAKRTILAAEELATDHETLGLYAYSLAFKTAIMASCKPSLSITAPRVFSQNESEPSKETSLVSQENLPTGKTLVYFLVSLSPTAFDYKRLQQCLGILTALMKNVLYESSILYWRTEGQEHELKTSKRIDTALGRASSALRKIANDWEHERLEQSYKGEDGPYFEPLQDEVNRSVRRIRQIEQDEKTTGTVLFILTDQNCNLSDLPSDIVVFQILPDGDGLTLRRK